MRSPKLRKALGFPIAIATIQICTRKQPNYPNQDLRTDFLKKHNSVHPAFHPAIL